MDNFDKKALELQSQPERDGCEYSLIQVRLALSEWLVKASYYLIDNASDYIFGSTHSIASDAFNPAKLRAKRYVLTDGQKISDVRLMTDSEYKDAQKSANCTDGNWFWVEVKPNSLAESHLQPTTDY